MRSGDLAGWENRFERHSPGVLLLAQQLSGGGGVDSDGGVLSHALTDALAGAIADDDLGTHFPKDDPEAVDVRSLTFVEHLGGLVRRRRMRLVREGRPSGRTADPAPALSTVV